MPNMSALRSASAGVAMAFAMALPAAAQPRPLEFVVGGMPPKEAPGEKLVFRIGELSAIQLVPRDGGAPNQHPRTVEPEVIRQQLAALRLTTPKGAVEPLFGEGEARDIAEPMAKALAAAKPDQDLLLLSTSRRDGSYFTAPIGLTARVFVANDRLNLIVHDARNEYYTGWRARNVRPEFTFGSRATVGKAQLQARAGELQRTDWAALPLTATAPVAAMVPAPAVVPPAPAVPADAENRLRTLKRLRDMNLISEDEYQQKRTEVLRTL